MNASNLVGTSLPNGAAVVAYSAERNLILAVTSGVYPYVTWRVNGDDLRSTYSGNYFPTLPEAWTDFCKR